MTREGPWYLTPRSMGRWQLRLIGFVLPLFGFGFGFLLGWLLVRFPGRDGYLSMPAPAWLLWVGLGCSAAALLAFAVARLASPGYVSDPDVPSDNPRPVGSGAAPQGLVFAATVCGALIVCAVASPDSEYRWRPVWAIVIMIVCTPIVLVMSRDRA